MYSSLVKCKLTVTRNSNDSTRSSILKTRKLRVLSLESSPSSFKSSRSSIESSCSSFELKWQRIYRSINFSYTVPVKCKLTVSTRNSILDPRWFQESRIEFWGSSFEFRVSSFEFWDARRSFRENDLYLEFVTIEINNTARRAASFICAKSTCISYWHPNR